MLSRCRDILVEAVRKQELFGIWGRQTLHKCIQTMWSYFSSVPHEHQEPNMCFDLNLHRDTL